MTVAELIKKLNDCKPDADIIFGHATFAFRNGKTEIVDFKTTDAAVGIREGDDTHGFYVAIY